MLTPWGETLDKSAPLREYPRPQLRRESYLNLNGEWDYAFTAKGLQGTFDGKEVHITQEGKIKKFIPKADAIGFSEKNAHANGQDIMYITERCVFVLGENGLVLTEIAPGIDLQKDILDLLDFEVEIANELKLMEF